MTTKTKQLKTVFESGSMKVAAANVDEAAHIIKHVKILGKESVNGRDYSRVITPKTSAMYEGASVYIGHVKNANESRSSNYGDRIGTIRNPVAESDGIYGDLHYNPKHPIAEAFVYDAKNSPTNLGLSHHADLVMSNAGKKNIVESIEKVHSVDLVNRPATNNGLFESEQPMPKTLKQVLESLPKETFGKSVLEDMMAGGAVSPEMPVDAEVGGSADGQIKAAFRSAVIAAFDDESLDTKATLAKMKDILTAYDKLTAKADAKPADTASGGGGDPANPAQESVDQKLARLTRLERENEARRLAVTEGVKLEDIDIKAVCALESADDRTAFVKRLPKVEAKEGAAPPPKPARSSSVTEAVNGGASGGESLGKLMRSN